MTTIETSFGKITYEYRARYYSADLGSFISRDPLEYVDGMNMYSGYFARGFGVDPSGEKVIIIFIEDGRKGEGVKARPLADVKDIFEFMKNVNIIGDSEFNKAEVSFDGKEFTGSKTEYINLVKRELESKQFTFYVNGTFDFAVKQYQKFATEMKHSHDRTLLVAHGVYDTKLKKPKGTVHFHDKEVPVDEVLESVTDVEVVEGEVALVSCFRNGKDKEFFHSWTKEPKILKGEKLIIQFTPVKVSIRRTPNPFGEDREPKFDTP